MFEEKQMFFPLKSSAIYCGKNPQSVNMQMFKSFKFPYHTSGVAMSQKVRFMVTVKLKHASE